MNNIAYLFSKEQFSLTYNEKSKILLDELLFLTNSHYKTSKVYKSIIDNLKLNISEIENLSELPYFPVRLFKEFDLKSIKQDEAIRMLTSSGTTGQSVSKIALDKETAKLQTKALVAIVSSYIGKKRLPMIIIDSFETIRGKSNLSARGAGLVGLANFGRDHFYALDANMKLKKEELLAFLKKYKNESILIFGFTFMVWQYFYSELLNSNLHFDLSNAILIHSGGWKKLQEQAVSNEIFKSSFYQLTNMNKIYNFYGMVEQVGSIYMECEKGFLHAPNFSEIIIRDYKDWSILPVGEIGVIQTLSVIPRSYPGHSLLTEDMGEIIGIDDCSCGKKGTYFKVIGRIPQAELRGCSDTHAAQVT